MNEICSEIDKRSCYQLTAKIFKLNLAVPNMYLFDQLDINTRLLRGSSSGGMNKAANNMLDMLR